MPLTRNTKEEILGGYGEAMASAEHAFVIGFKGITVNQVNDLRGKVRKSGGEYVVIKNTLARLAVAGKPLEQVKEHFTGPTAIAYSLADPVALAKVLTDFAKDAPVIEFKGGLVEGRPIAGTQVKEIASLPGRQELLAKLLYLMQSPIQRFVGVLAASGPQRLAIVLDQVAKKKE
ncbi:MAG: 50S ribosomal protein L10 [Thermoanaerobaculia bacterium]